MDWTAIPYLHWQLKIGRNSAPNASVWGEIVHGLDDVEQSIQTIILTEKGSVPTQPEKCTRLNPYIDRRPDYAIPNICREIFDAIAAWEPRVIVERVAITPEDFEHWRFPVFWRLRADVERTLRQTIIVLPQDRAPENLT